MSKQLMILGLLLLSFCGKLYCKICSDCQHYTSCAAAFNVIREDPDAESEEKFKDIFCGVDYIDGDRIPKVCCSEFSAQTEDLNQHPNIHLLPKSCGYIDSYPSDTQRASLYEFPWMALLNETNPLNTRYVCDGIIINNRYVLSTIFCTVNHTPSIVRVGDYNPDTHIDCMPETNSQVCENFIQDLSIEEIIPHPNSVLNLPNVKHNIALIRLKDEIDFTHRNIAPICLPISTNIRSGDKINKTGTVAGWLWTGGPRDYSTLFKLPAMIEDPKKCIYKKSHNMSEDALENAFCALMSFGENNILCIGMGGDPFMVVDKFNDITRYILYGIYSHGSTRCSNLPDVYMDVTKYVKWILDNIKP